jgi:glyoxylase-like metal-dependent hydrolase (beta-lactamase superfamily II)
MLTAPARTSVISRRSILRAGALTAAASTLRPSLLFGQAATTDPLAQMRAPAATTPITTTRLYDNLFLLQGEGGNMAVQIGPDGKVLIDASYLTAVPRILDVLNGLSKDPNDALINTHWHVDHADGNQGLHQAGFTIFAHTKTRERLSTPQSVKLLGISLPAYPAAAWPVITFEESLRAYHNGDTLDLVHFAPAHTDTDIYIHFQKANVLHVGDAWFNNNYPFIDEGTGGNIGGMIQATRKALELADSSTRIIPGHGPLGTKAELQQFHDMLSAVRDRVAAVKARGASEKETVAKDLTADFDEKWGKGFMNAATFTGIVYRTV